MRDPFFIWIPALARLTTTISPNSAGHKEFKILFSLCHGGEQKSN